jgi:hypothetical protein
VPIWKISKKGYLPPRAGYLPPIQQAGGAKYFSRPLPRASSRIRNLFAKRPLMRPREHPARPTGGRSGARTVRRGIPPVGRAGCSPAPIQTPTCPQIPFLFSKNQEKKREERKRGEEAAKPCSHVGLVVYSRSSRIIT